MVCPKYTPATNVNNKIITYSHPYTSKVIRRLVQSYVYPETPTRTHNISLNSPRNSWITHIPANPRIAPVKATPGYPQPGRIKFGGQVMQHVGSMWIIGLNVSPLALAPSLNSRNLPLHPLNGESLFLSLRHSYITLRYITSSHLSWC